MSKFSTIIIVLLVLIIGVLGWLLWTKTAEAPSTAPGTDIPGAQNPDAGNTSGGTTPPAPKPLHERVSVTSPKANASVSKKFTIAGKAPGNWFFEASAPYMVTTPDGDKVAQGAVQAQGDWMTTELVDFKGDVTVNAAYSGPATLVLMKDNPSGLPENEDSLEIPIIIQ